MRRAWLNLRLTLPKRVGAFAEGLRRHGYAIEMGLPLKAIEGDLLLTWNRIGTADKLARDFEAIGSPVLVAENAAWGNEFAGGHWHSIARRYHNTADCFEYGGPDRWDEMRIPLEPRRYHGDTVILPQRGIGSAPTVMPQEWPFRARVKHGGRIRPHPGRFAPAVSLREDLVKARRVVTWGSGAAILAALWGCDVISDMPGWIGEHRPDERLAMFRRLAWAQWRMEEIESGEAFAHLLCEEGVSG